MNSESTFIGKEPCPSCGSRDNLGRYDDGHGYCFGCGHYEPGNDKPATERKGRKQMAAGLIAGEIRALNKRGITEETCRHWQYESGRDASGRPVQIANYKDAEGNIVAQKHRFPGKDFRFVGDPKKALPLYGQWLWRDGGKMVVVTEGEIDALTVSQLQGNKWPVVSVPNGAQGAAKSVAKAIEWLEKFERVVFMFDADDPGRAAVAACAPLLTPGKAFNATIAGGFKDANEALQAGAGKAVIDAIWSAKAYRPDGVVGVDDLIDRAMTPVERGISWPWKTLTEKTYGIRRKEVYAFGGGTGVGKSDTFKEIAIHLIEQGHRVGGVFLEEPPAHTLKVCAGKVMRKRVHVPGVVFDPNELRAVMASFADKLFLYDHFGAMSWETIKEKIRYMVLSLGCRDIFVDHLTALATAVEDDERKALDLIMADISTLAQQLDCTIYFISHLSTPDGKSHEEGGRVLERHFRGSRSIGYWSHFVFALERDKQEIGGVTTFRVLKDRYTGDANGLTFGLRYDRDTGRVSECELPSDDCPFPNEEGGDF